jgi:hypothetical protein
VLVGFEIIPSDTNVKTSKEVCVANCIRLPSKTKLLQPGSLKL